MWANDWLAEQHAADQRRFQQLLTGSFVAHLLVFAGLALSPSSDPLPLPAVLRVDLVAGVPSAPAGGPPRAAPKAAPKPPPKALPPPAPKAAPAPPPQPKQVVLPKQAPKAVPKKRVVTPPPRPEPVEYDDAMAQLRNELGETTPSPSAPAEEVSDADLLATAKPGTGSSSAAPSDDAAAAAAAAVDKKIAEWVLATQRHVRNRWITPPEFRSRGLATVVEVELTGSGVVRGTPRVVRPSGDPFYDDNAVRAVMASSPLPAPPSAGTWTFKFAED